MALDSLVLRLKSLKIQDVYSFDYIQKLDKQQMEGMEASVKLLKLIGCLDKNGNITKIGEFLLKIPIEPFLARAIV